MVRKSLILAETCWVMLRSKYPQYFTYAPAYALQIGAVSCHLNCLCFVIVHLRHTGMLDPTHIVSPAFPVHQYSWVYIKPGHKWSITVRV